MEPVKEVYGYVMRYVQSEPQVFVFKTTQDVCDFQIPKGVVREQEDTYTQVIKEVKDKTGIDQFERTSFIVDDLWVSKKGKVYHRFFYKLLVFEEEETKDILASEVLRKDHFSCGYWITSKESPTFQEGHGDYLSWIL